MSSTRDDRPGEITITRHQFTETSHRIAAAPTDEIDPFGLRGFVGIRRQDDGTYLLHNKIGVGFIVDSSELTAFYAGIRSGQFADQLRLDAKHSDSVAA